jgi:exodeoxyribonuclease-3
VKTVTIASWNINSVRLRAPLVTAFLKAHRPDILCLQETKCPDDLFPFKPFAELGYTHTALNGQKGYHGVAVLSRVPFDKHLTKEFCGKQDSRHVCVFLEDGTEIHNLYVPAGGDVPDPEENEKFAHKLQFMEELTAHFKKRKGKAKNRMVLLGDLNIAPFEHDVWSHKQMLKVVSHTPVEIDLMDGLRKSHDWVDVTREERPEPEKVYTWWSYRAKDWDVSDRGRRLDHIWVTPALGDRARNVRILREARGWERPSDHVPLLMDLDVES